MSSLKGYSSFGNSEEEDEESASTPAVIPVNRSQHDTPEPTGHDADMVNNSKLYLSTAVSCLGALSFGYVMGYSSPAGPNLIEKGFLTKNTESWFASVVTLGAMLGGPLAGFMIERLSRKLTIMLCSIPYVIGWLLIAYSTYTNGVLAMLIAGRVISGLAVGMTSLVVPVYIAETSTCKLRGGLGSCFQLAITAGILLAYIAGYGLDYQWMAILGAVFPTLMVICMAFMPQTPHYLLRQNRRGDAQQSLRWLRGPRVDPDDECCEIEAGLDNQEEMKLSEFAVPSLYKPLLISLMLMVFQQFSGINSIMFYTQSIFQSAGFTDGHLPNIIIGLTQLVFTGIAALLMDKAGRRKLLICAGLAMTISTVTFGLYYQLTPEENPTSTSLSMGAVTPTSPPSNSKLAWLSLLSMIVYIIGFSLGWGAIPWLIMSEIFPSRARGVASGLATLLNWACAFVVTKEFSDMEKSMTTQGTFWFYSGVCLLAAVFVYLFVPETKGRTLEEIEAEFEGRNPSSEF